MPSRRWSSTAGGTAPRSVWVCATPPSWAGSPGGSTTRPQTGTAACCTRSACQPPTARTPGRGCSTPCGSTRRPAATGCASSSSTRWPGHGSSPTRTPPCSSPPSGSSPASRTPRPTPPGSCCEAGARPQRRNLGRLGRREPAVYGSATYAELVQAVETTAAELGLDVVVAQTDDEGELVRLLHTAADEAGAVVLNAAAWTHYSVAVRDAAAMVDVPLVEVHLSNVGAREEFRRHSVLAEVATGVIAGFGLDSYRLALRAVAAMADRSAGWRSRPTT